jgi:hypothetical protein
MAYFGMWILVGLVITDVSEECVSSIFRVDRISDIGITLAVTSKFLPLYLQVRKNQHTKKNISRI